MDHNSLFGEGLSHPTDKEAWQAEVLAEDRKNTEWIVGGK